MVAPETEQHPEVSQVTDSPGGELSQIKSSRSQQMFTAGRPGRLTVDIPKQTRRELDICSGRSGEMDLRIRSSNAFLVANVSANLAEGWGGVAGSCLSEMILREFNCSSSPEWITD